MLGKTHYANGRPVFELEGDRLTYFFKTGRTKAQGRFRDGVMQGEWRFWRESGELWQVGGFRDGRKHGEWVRRARDGSIESRLRFENGKPANERPAP